MLVSKGHEHHIHARPMAIAKHDNKTGDIYFATSVDSLKTSEIEQNPMVCVTMQSSSQFVALSGKAKILNDRKMIHELYVDVWKMWFPKGPEDETIRLIHFDPDNGEYWDLSGFSGVRFLWEAGKAIVNGEEFRLETPETHSQVKL